MTYLKNQKAMQEIPLTGTILVLLSILDVLLTLQALGLGLNEANPLAAYLIHKFGAPTALSGLKAIGLTVMGALMLLSYRKEWLGAKTLQVGLRACCVIMTGVCAWNAVQINLT